MSHHALRAGPDRACSAARWRCRAPSRRCSRKALESEADTVFLDLEDAVAPADKEQARLNVIAVAPRARLARPAGKTIMVRVNGIDTHYFYRDMVDVIEQAGHRLDLVLIPKVGVPADVYLTDALLTQIETAKGIPHRIGIEVLIETSLGMANVEAIAQSSRAPRGDALRRGGLRRQRAGAHREHRRAQSRLPRRPVALRARRG